MSFTLSRTHSFTLEPPRPAELDAGKYKLGSYSRLISEDDYLGCLADGFPFLLGIECFESIDSNDLCDFRIRQGN